MKLRISRLSVVALAAILLASCLHKKEAHSPFFVQISDPQLGFITESADFTPERENMGRIAAAVNRLQPDFVVFSGDYVQWRTEESLDGFKQMCELFDENIPLYFVPGNHDVGEATAEDVEAFVARYGHDRFVHEGAAYTTIGYNSCVIKTIAEGEAKEYEWMRESLAKAAERQLPIILVAHHPIFSESVDEAEAGVNLPKVMREKYLALMNEYGVDLILSGHLHHCVSAEWGNMKLYTSSAAGRPLGEEESGITIVTFPNGIPTPTFYEIANIPENIE
ncbi:MAG: metallophosphoesterase [Tidjanibacter sp.]|nr:metallophosphoesterase [Tidjanibacter sp.]